MTAQVLDRVLTSYRIGDQAGAHPIYDVTGSKLYPGRWNTPTSPMLYTSEHYSTAMLEKLAHANGLLPPNQHFITVTIPNRTSYEVLDVAALPGWDHAACLASKAHGEAWYEARRSALLIVPSVVARHEHNFLINLDHPDARAITHSLHQPVWWDNRLFSAASP